MWLMAIALRNFCEQITSSISNLIVFISYYFITFYNYFKEKFSFLHKQLLTLSDNIIQKKKFDQPIHVVLFLINSNFTHINYD